MKPCKVCFEVGSKLSCISTVILFSKPSESLGSISRTTYLPSGLNAIDPAEKNGHRLHNECRKYDLLANYLLHES